MSSSPTAKKVPWLKLGIAAAVVAVVGILILRGVDVRAWLNRLMDMVRSAGPTAFFLGLVLLPAMGVPVLAFVLTAGSAFGPQLGMPLVVTLCIVCTILNLILSYSLARWAFRPGLTRLMQRMGYSLPRVEGGDIMSLIIILRVTPGIPFFVQNYLLGLAEAPFVRYVLVSSLLSFPQTIGFVLFGDALTQGKGKLVIAAIGLLVAASLTMQIIRRRYARKGSATA